MKEKFNSKFNKYLPDVVGFLFLLLITVIGGAYVAPKIYMLGSAFLIIYALVFLGARLIVKFLFKDKTDKETSELFTNVTVELLMELKMPVAILDSEGAILWYNQSFADRCDEKTLYNTKINDLLENKLNINHLKEALDGESLDAYFSGVKFRVDSYRIKSGNNEFFITVWNDRTEEEALREKLDMTNPVIAYIYVDNGADVSSHLANEYRAVTAKISKLLSEWISGMNGVLREFDRDKYIAVFDKEHIEKINESKCDILDKVREASENSEVDVSVSIGIACLESATLTEKEQTAHRAIELAMQRGGDQAVLQYDDTADYYGGKFKAVQKRSKVRSRIVANEIIDLVKASGNVIIMGHKFADHDSIGSCIGMASFCLEFCNSVNVVVNRTDDNIRAMIGRMEKLDKYANVFIDSQSAQDLIAYNTLLIICDVNNPSIFESREVYENVKNVVVIDHHRKTGEFITEPKITYIEPSASSASELVAEIYEQAYKPGTLLNAEADALFAGIVLDTKSFTKNAGVRTFLAAHYLRREGANPSEIENFFKTTFDEFRSEARFENSVVIYKNSIAISMPEGEGISTDKVCASKVADKLMSVDGIQAAFALCKIGNVTHISARSNGSINVQLILEKLNGGGHYDAAGAQVADDPLDRVLLRLRDAIDEYLETK